MRKQSACCKQRGCLLMQNSFDTERGAFSAGVTQICSAHGCKAVQEGELLKEQAGLHGHKGWDLSPASLILSG